MNDAFYIGYQKEMPPKIASFLRTRIIGLFALAIAVGIAIVRAQHPFPASRFEFGKYRDFEGIISARPYPTLILCEPEAACSRYFLVQAGKHGAQSLFSDKDGQRVRLRGSLIYRDDQHMIEVDASSVLLSGAMAQAGTNVQELGTFTLRGEIVDSKCFLGVMNPGNLKTHKACAIRCISGGCPPVLVVRDEKGMAEYFVLASVAGGPLGPEILDFVAEPVEIAGDVEKRDNQLVLKIDPKKLRRL